MCEKKHCRNEVVVFLSQTFPAAFPPLASNTHTHTCVPAFGTVLHCTPCSCRSAAAPAGVLPLKYVVVIRPDVLMRMFSAVSPVWKPALKWHEPQQTCCLITGCHFLLPTVAPILMLLSLMLRLPHYFNTKHAAQRWTQFVILCLFFVSNFIFHSCFIEKFLSSFSKNIWNIFVLYLAR